MYIFRLCSVYLCSLTSVTSSFNYRRSPSKLRHVYGNPWTCSWCACVYHITSKTLYGLRSNVIFTAPVQLLPWPPPLNHRHATSLFCSPLLMWLSHRRCFKCGGVRYTMGEILLGTFSFVHYHQMDDKLQAYDLFEILILNLHLSILMIITLDVILYGPYEIFIFMQTHGKTPNSA